MRLNRRWLAAGLLLVTLVLIVATPGSRTWVLRRAGWALVAEDALAPADAIVLTVDAGPPGVLEAIDLVKAGLSSRVDLFVEPREPDDDEFIRRGLPFEDRAAKMARELLSVGIVDVKRIAPAVDGTEDQGPALAEWCVSERLAAVIVVGRPDHTRRLRRVLRRSMRDQSTRVIVRAARFSVYDPDRWWQRRAGIRVQIEESQKLLLDLIRHPIS